MHAMHILLVARVIHGSIMCLFARVDYIPGWGATLKAEQSKSKAHIGNIFYTSYNYNCPYHIHYYFPYHTVKMTRGDSSYLNSIL